MGIVENFARCNARRWSNEAPNFIQRLQASAQSSLPSLETATASVGYSETDMGDARRNKEIIYSEL